MTRETRDAIQGLLKKEVLKKPRYATVALKALLEEKKRGGCPHDIHELTDNVVHQLLEGLAPEVAAAYAELRKGEWWYG